MKKVALFSSLVLIVTCAICFGACTTECDHANAVVTVVDPDCTNEGYNMNECPDCGYVWHDTFVPANPEQHVYGWIDHVDATCTEEGYDYYVCAWCGVEKTETLEISDHSFGEWVVVEETTCSHLGYEERVCTGCGLVERQDATELLEHTWSEPEVVEPTCSKKGSETRVCTACGEEKVDVLAKLPHTYGDTQTKKPTCTEHGKVYEICSVCGDEHILAYLATDGHKYGEWSVSVDQTCDEKGVEKRECTVEGCDHVDTRPIDEHTYVETVKAPTCSSVGYTEHKCEDCGYAYITDYLPAIGHLFGEWYDVENIEDLERRDCECGHFEVRTKE